MPSVGDTVLKLIRSPIQHELSRKYVINCASCNGLNRSTALAFHDNLVIHDDIREIAGFKFDIVVSDRKGDVLPERNPGPGQLITQAPMVD